VTTGADGTATLLLSYDAGTINRPSITAKALAPVYSQTAYPAPFTLNPNAVVDVSIDVKHYVLNTPTWLRTATSNTNAPLIPMVAETIPAIGSDGTIYTIGYQSERSTAGYRLVATNPNGTAKWESSTRFALEEYSAPSIGPDGSIYILTYGGSSNSKLYAFNTDGSLKWSFATPTGYYTTSRTPAIGANGRIYFVSAPYNSSTGRLYAIDPATGTPVWTVELNDIVSYTQPSPVIGPNGAIYVPGTRLRAFAPNGTLLATSSVATRAEGALSLGPDGSIYSSYGGDGESSGPYMQAFNADLSLRWFKYYGSHRAMVGPDGGIYTSTSYSVAKLDPATGAVLWSLAVPMYESPVIGADGSIYLPVYTSASDLPVILTVIRLDANGTELSRFRTYNSNAYGLIMAPGGTIYTSIASTTNANGYDLIAIPTASTGPAAGWSSQFGNAQNSNRRAP
jgi:outer membrane protein assembly factor BamB